jgi:hypothetical protein
MPHTISSSDLRKMSAEDRERFIEAAFTDSGEALVGYLDLLDNRLRVFEQRYEMPSSELPAAVEGGKLRETAEISEWLFWADIRRQLAREARP